jgi:GAF domain-containing protein
VGLASTRPLTGERLRLLELFQRSFGLALHNAVTYDHLERLAALDPLTGAYKRRFGLGRLHEEYQRAAGRAGAGLRSLQGGQRHLRPPSKPVGLERS